MTTKELSQMNVHQRLAEAIKCSGAIAKTGKMAGGGGNFQYHKIDDVVDHLRDILLEFGLAVIPSVVSNSTINFTEPRQGGGDRRVYHTALEMAITVFNVDNPTDQIVMRTVGDGIDYGDKSTGKAFSYAMKTGLLALFQLRGQPDNEDDAHDHPAHSHAPAPQQPRTSTAPPASAPPSRGGNPLGETVLTEDEIARRKAEPWLYPDLTRFEERVKDWRAVVNHRHTNFETKQREPLPLGECTEKDIRFWHKAHAIGVKSTREDLNLRVALNVAVKEMDGAKANPTPPPSDPPVPDDCPF